MSSLSISHEDRSSPKVRSLVGALRKVIFDLPDGALIGKENDLCARFGCTRAMLRQASRQLEIQGLLYIRRGPAGGYFAARPVMDTVIDIAALYFIGRGTTLDEALQAAMCCTLEVVRLASNCSSTSPAYVRMALLYDELTKKYPEDMDCAEFVSDEGRIDEVMFEMIEIAPLEFLVKILNKFSLAEFEVLFVRQPMRRSTFRACRMETIKAVLEHRSDDAVASMMKVHELIHEWLPNSARTATLGTGFVLQ